MRYFNRIDTLEALKAEFRRLAMENHPDRGGKVETMQEINTQFELAFVLLQKKQPAAAAESSETASSFRSQFYTANGWAGSRYSSKLGTRDIAPIIRGYLKDVYPSWKFSVTRDGGTFTSSLYIALMEAPAPIFTEEGIRAWARKQVWQRNFHGTDEQAYEYGKEQFAKGHFQNWEYYIECMTDRAREVLEDIKRLVESYRYDDSDAMVDYFDTNFYSHYDIGKWDRPMKVVVKQERIQTAEGSAEARRIA